MTPADPILHDHNAAVARLSDALIAAEQRRAEALRDAVAIVLPRATLVADRQDGPPAVRHPSTGLVFTREYVHGEGWRWCVTCPDMDWDPCGYGDTVNEALDAFAAPDDDCRACVVKLRA